MLSHQNRPEHQPYSLAELRDFLAALGNPNEKDSYKKNNPQRLTCIDLMELLLDSTELAIHDPLLYYDAVDVLLGIISHELECIEKDYPYPWLWSPDHSTMHDLLAKKFKLTTKDRLYYMEKLLQYLQNGFNKKIPEKITEKKVWKNKNDLLHAIEHGIADVLEKQKDVIARIKLLPPKPAAQQINMTNFQAEYEAARRNRWLWTAKARESQVKFINFINTSCDVMYPQDKLLWSSIKKTEELEKLSSYTARRATYLYEAMKVRKTHIFTDEENSKLLSRCLRRLHRAHFSLITYDERINWLAELHTHIIKLETNYKELIVQAKQSGFVDIEKYLETTKANIVRYMAEETVKKGNPGGLTSKLVSWAINAGVQHGIAVGITKGAEQAARILLNTASGTLGGPIVFVITGLAQAAMSVPEIEKSVALVCTTVIGKLSAVLGGQATGVTFSFIVEPTRKGVAKLVAYYSSIKPEDTEQIKEWVDILLNAPSGVSDDDKAWLRDVLIPEEKNALGNMQKKVLPS